MLYVVAVGAEERTFIICHTSAAAAAVAGHEERSVFVT